jgi:hypothetical protein
MGIFLIICCVIAVFFIIGSKVKSMEDFSAGVIGLSLILTVIAFLTLLLQVSTRQFDYNYVNEKIEYINSFTENVETISPESKRIIIKDISYVNKQIKNTKHYRNNWFIGAYYNPLIEKLDELSYDAISAIPLHQSVTQSITVE